jgi:cell division protein DivIC
MSSAAYLRFVSKIVVFYIIMKHIDAENKTHYKKSLSSHEQNKRMNSVFSNIWQFVSKHKYILVVLFFLCIILVLDENSMIRRVAQKRQIKALKEEVEKYQKQIDEGERTLMELESDSLLKEHLAREKYKMRRSDEDVFIEE